MKLEFSRQIFDKY